MTAMGSLIAVAASSKRTPCFLKLSFAFVGSHSILMIQIISIFTIICSEPLSFKTQHYSLLPTAFFHIISKKRGGVKQKGRLWGPDSWQSTRRLTAFIFRIIAKEIRLFAGMQRYSRSRMSEIQQDKHWHGTCFYEWHEQLTRRQDDENE